MDTIELHKTLPSVFASQDIIESDVWHKEISFERGKCYLIRAKSGTGKSSLCTYIMGQRYDYEGLICFDGRNIRSISQSEWIRLRQNTLSHLYQDLRLFPELSVIENIQIKNKLTNHLKKKQIRALLCSLGIAEKENERVDRLSFGQQQRVAFVRALAQPFDFLIIDEPISHLDDINAEIMADVIKEECRCTGAGLIVTSIGRHLDLPYDATLEM